MENRKIHVHIRIPTARQFGADVVEEFFGAVDALRGVKRISPEVRVDTRKLPDDAVPDGEEWAGMSRAEQMLDEVLARAEEGTKAAYDALLSFIEEIRLDIDAICERDPAARSRAEVLLLYSGLHALMIYRASHALYAHEHFFLARLLSQSGRFFTGIEIHPGAQIGRGLFIDHGSGVVIGETAIVGDNCTLYQGVTLGGTGKDIGKRHPTLGNNVMVGAGAKLLGNFTVGDNVKIAAGAVVLGDVPENCTAVGIPARVVRRAGERVANDMDQTHIPDPVSQQFCRIGVKLDELEAKLSALQSAAAFADMAETEPTQKAQTASDESEENHV